LKPLDENIGKTLEDIGKCNITSIDEKMRARIGDGVVLIELTKVQYIHR
jgi:hypothetical protein